MADPVTYPVTFVIQEIDTPLPPACPDPLIYTLMLPLDEVQTAFKNTQFRNSEDDLHLRLELAKARYEDIEGGETTDEEFILEIAEGLKILFAFPGNLTPCFDYRT